MKSMGFLSRASCCIVAFFKSIFTAVMEKLHFFFKRHSDSSNSQGHRKQKAALESALFNPGLP